MVAIRSLTTFVAALFINSSQARLPYQQGPPGHAADVNGNYQSIPSTGRNIPSGRPQFYGNPGYNNPEYPGYSTGGSVGYPTGGLAGSPTGYSPYQPTGNVPYAPTGTAPARRARPTYVYGTNTGGHLIVEKWMTPDLFDNTDATDQWSLDQTYGAEAKLKKHWDTYYTKEDFVKIKEWGLNTVRIPIGYWAYDNSGTPYIQGADYYLERMIEWCREIGLWVLVDCHGSPGSQNGFDNSGRAGKAHWQSGNNLQKSTAVLKTIAQKYGSMKYADVVWGIQLVNEPISWNDNKLEVTQQWTQKAYPVVRAAAANKDLVILMHDGFMGPSNWIETGEAINSAAAQSYNPTGRRTSYSNSESTSTFAIDTHLYQNQAPEDKNLTQHQHILKACAWTHTNLLSSNTTKNTSSPTLPVYIGEFSAATDICANPDGSTLPGSACYEDGCQCANNVDIENWQRPLKDATRQFFEAELEAFEKGAQGWFVWSWKGPGGWGLENLVREGVVGRSVGERKFGGVCGSQGVGV